MDKSKALPYYMYGDPAEFMDAHLEQKKRDEEWEKRRFEIARRRNKRKIQAIMKRVMRRR